MDQTNWQGRLVVNDLPGIWDRLDTRLSLTRYRHLEIEVEDDERFLGTRFDSSSRELRTELIHGDVNGWHGYTGLSYQHNDLEASGEEAFIPPAKTSRWGLYLVEEYHFAGDMALELGGRWDRQTVKSAGFADLDHDSFNLSSSLLVPLSDRHRLGLILSRTQRAPVVQELLSDGEHVATSVYEIGDPNLKSERALNAEISYLYRIGGNTLRATLYHNRFRDYIFLQDTELLFNHELEEAGASGLAACSTAAGFDHPEEAEDALECFAYRQENARFTGLEAEGIFPLGNGHSLRLWGDMVRAKLNQSGDVPRMPPARIGTSWQYDRDNWSGQLSLLRAFAQDRPGEGQEETDGYLRLDAFVNYNLGGVDLFLRGTNLTNREIRNATSFLREIAPEPGRSVVMGVRYSF